MTLHFYFARKFMLRFFGVLFGFLAISVLSESLVILNSFDSQNMGYGEALRLSLFKAPAGIYRMLPIVVTLASLSLYTSLSRSSELIITRAAGRSALRGLVAPALMAVLIGGVGVAVFNPILAATKTVYDRTTSQLISGGFNSFSLSREGLWLRQGGKNGQTVIFAERANFDGTRLFEATFFEFGVGGGALRRTATKSARLQPGQWLLRNGKTWNLGGEAIIPEQTATEFETTKISTDLTSDQILDSFGNPTTVSIWDMSDFIQRLENSGFSALRYRVYLHLELAQPLLLAGMVMIAAGFSMRPMRFGNTGLMVLFAVLTGFAIFFLRNFAQILGANGEIPIILAAWGPPIVAICFGLGLLLHLEDG